MKNDVPKTNRAIYVRKLKELIESIDENVDDTNKVRDISKYANRLHHVVAYLHTGLYVGIYEVGSDSDFTVVHELLGRMTESEAKTKLNTIDNNGHNREVREVSEEEWKLYSILQRLSDFKEHCDDIKDFVEIPKDLNVYLENQINSLCKKLGLHSTYNTIIK